MACAGCGVGRHGGRAASHTRHATVGPRKYFLRPGRQCRRLSPQATASAFSPRSSLLPFGRNSRVPNAISVESKPLMKPAPQAAAPKGPPSAPTVRGARCPYGLGCVLRTVDPIHDKLWNHVALPAAAATAAPGAQQDAPSLLRRAVADGIISRSLKVRFDLLRDETRTIPLHLRTTLIRKCSVHLLCM